MTSSCADHVELEEVGARDRTPDPFAAVLSPVAWRAFQKAMDAARRAFAGRVFWHVNSTAQGGGVAEMLESLVPHLRSAGIDARWLVIGGDEEFFRVTKRLHNRLHGARGDGGSLGPAEREIYEATLSPYAAKLRALVRPRDVVMCHDPQTAGLLAAVADVPTIWRCHVGLDEPNDVARSAWDFLRPHVASANGLVFSRREHVWDGLDERTIAVIPPAIDVFSAKNQPLDRPKTEAILVAAGFLDGRGNEPATFERADGTPSEIRRRIELLDGSGPAPKTAPLVVQVSRFDRLKDAAGVIEAFCRQVVPRSEAHLVIAGPEVCDVADDPEGVTVLEETLRALERQPAAARARVHVATLPMEDDEENSAIVNAAQRRADVVVQKSLAEGFGLTVTEAMWKARPVVGSRVGGIADQIVDGVTGFLVAPKDEVAFGDAVVTLVQDPERASRMGAAGRERVIERFLETRHLVDCVELAERLLEGRPAAA